MVELGVLVFDLRLGVGGEETEGVPAVVAGDGVGLHLESVRLSGLESGLGLEIDGRPLLGGHGSLGRGDKNQERDEGAIVKTFELLEGVDGIDVDGRLHHGVVELRDNEAEGGHHGNTAMLELSLPELHEGLCILSLGQLKGIEEAGGLGSAYLIIPPLWEAIGLGGGGGLLLEERSSAQGGRGGDSGGDRCKGSRGGWSNRKDGGSGGSWSKEGGSGGSWSNKEG